MSLRLPPIAALRALESAARHLSYTRAAEELHVTQSAVSHQIRHIEDMWGVKLFNRKGRRLMLTRPGQAVAPVVRDFIERMTSTLAELQSEGDRGSMKVSLLQSFAFKWLVPRLGNFNDQHPGVDVWISTTESLVGFDDEGLDIAIRLGHGDYPGLDATLLLSEYVFPVASPVFLNKHSVPAEPADLLSFPLLYRHAVDICPRWRDWFADAGVEVSSLPKGTHFPDTSMSVQAALDGQGIALARSAHVQDDLEAGRLIKLFNVYSLSQVAYYIVCPQEHLARPRVAAFKEWLLMEAAISQTQFDRTAGRPKQEAVNA